VGVQLVVCDTGLHLFGQSSPEIIGEREPPKPYVIRENRHLRKVFLEEVIDAAGLGLTTKLIDNAEAAESVGNLTDHFGAGGSVGSNIVQV
jgi:hypothetical protein